MRSVFFNRIRTAGRLLPPMLLSLLFFGVGHAEDTATKIPAVDSKWIYLTVAVLFLVFGGVIGFMFVLHKKYLEACTRNQQINVYSKSPAGLPEGTVRAMISFIIIAVSLYLCVLLFFQIVGEGSTFPEALSSLLGAVVGFYFGSRSSKSDDGKMLQEQLSGMEKERDTGQSDTLLTKINKGIVMSRAVIDALPEEQKKMYGELLENLEKGYQTVNAISRGGNVSEAVAKGKALFDLFRKENPVRDIFSKALEAFIPVLSGSVPALAVIATVVDCGVKLVGSTYEKWKKRILNVPITPAVLPLQPVDANTGFTLLLKSPIFKMAFKEKFEANDRPFMRQTTELLVASDADVDECWNQYKTYFDSREQFDQGLQQFRKAALDRELAADTQDDPALFSQVGGLGTFMDALDQINTDADAQAALHQLAMVVETLHKQGEPVPAIFEKLKKEEEL
ncbi:uncharacterized protein Dvar_22650 [Desulfosarcina variabilis str. Montpellier]|uniref:hypothetical protein n=1 Tax=Desulfosarcina variabilis TaxID=2300 RepID=UPI003AFB8176